MLPLSSSLPLLCMTQPGRQHALFPNHGEVEVWTLLLPEASCLACWQRDGTAPTTHIHDAYNNTEGIFTALIVTYKGLLLAPTGASVEQERDKHLKSGPSISWSPSSSSDGVQTKTALLKSLEGTSLMKLTPLLMSSATC